MDGDAMSGLGFYKNDNGMLLFGENLVVNTEYELVIENKDKYNYPVDGWYLFESEEKAREFFRLPKVVEQNSGGDYGFNN